MPMNKKPNVIGDAKYVNVHPSITHSPMKGELAWAPIHPFRITSLRQVMLQANDFFTASTLYRPKDKDHWDEVFQKLEEEEKIKRIGKVNSDLKIVLSNDGREWLNKMQEQYDFGAAHIGGTYGRVTYN